MGVVRRGSAVACIVALSAAIVPLARPALALDEALLAEVRSGPRGFALRMSLAETTQWDAVVSLAEIETPAVVPARARKLYRKALKADRKNRIEQAVRLLQQALEIAPGFFQAHGALAVGYLKLGDLKEAERHAATAVAINPQYLPGREIEAIVCLVRGRYREAADMLKELARLSPTRRTVHYYLAKALLRSGETGLAEEHLTRATALLRRQSVPRGWPRIPDWQPADLHLPWRR